MLCHNDGRKHLEKTVLINHSFLGPLHFRLAVHFKHMCTTDFTQTNKQTNNQTKAITQDIL